MQKTDGLSETSEKHERYLSVSEVAKRLGFHPQTVYKMKREGLLPFTSLGRSVRCAEADLDSFLKSRSFSPPAVPVDISTVDFHDGCGRRIRGRCKKVNGGTRITYGKGHGSIFERKTKEGKTTFYVAFQIGGVRVREVVKGARIRADAIQVLNSKLGEAFTGKYGLKPKTPELTFAEMFDKYLEKYAKEKKKGWERADAIYKKPLCTSFGQLRLRDVTPEKVEDYRSRRIKDGLKGSSVNRELACLRKLFNKAIDWGHAVMNPVKKGMMFSEKDNGRTRIMSPDEEVRLIQALPDYLRHMIFVWNHAGMRRSEVFKLRWEQVDFDAKEIYVVNSKGKPRVIPINPELLLELQSLRASAVYEYVFANPATGRPYVDVNHAWRKACAKAGISGLWVHDLRRTFATRLDQQGTSAFTLQSLMGHASVTTTQRYVSVQAEAKRAAVETLCKKSIKPEPPRQTSVNSESAEPVPVPATETELVS